LSNTCHIFYFIEYLIHFQYCLAEGSNLLVILNDNHRTCYLLSWCYWSWCLCRGLCLTYQYLTNHVCCYLISNFCNVTTCNYIRYLLLNPWVLYYLCCDTWCNIRNGFPVNHIYIH
jgi:hypothetical protein